MSTITFVPTQRGGTALLFDGYRYNKVRCNNDKNVTYWRCSKNRNCPGRAVTVDNRVKKTNNKHNHPPETPLPHHHHHALLGHHHQSLHQQQQHQLLQHHGLHSGSPNPFLSARHAATAAAAAALAAATNHRHYQQQQQQQQHHHHHNHPHQFGAGGHQQPAEHHHFLHQSHSPSSNVGSASHHHNLLQQFANAAASVNQHQHLGSGPSAHAAVAAAALAAANTAAQQSRQHQQSSVPSPPMPRNQANPLASGSSSSASSGNAFLNQLSDTLRFQKNCLMNQANPSSSPNSSQAASDSLQAQLSLFTRLGGHLTNGPFKGGAGNPFNLALATNKDMIPGNSINKINSNSGESSARSLHLDNDSSAAALAASAAAIRNLQSTIASQQNRSSPISSASSSNNHINHNHNNNLQRAPTRSPSTKTASSGGGGGVNFINSHNHTVPENDKCESRSVSLSPSLSPSSLDNNTIKTGIPNQFDQMKSSINRKHRPTASPSIANEDGVTLENVVCANNMRQILKCERMEQDCTYSSRSDQQLDTTSNALLSSTQSPTNLLADYLASTLKCLFAATGGLTQQQLAALGSSIHAALAGNNTSVDSTTATNEATSAVMINDKTTIKLPNSNDQTVMSASMRNNSACQNDTLVRKLDETNNNIHEGNTSNNVVSHASDKCGDHDRRNIKDEDIANKIDNDSGHNKTRLNSFSSSNGNSNSNSGCSATLEERNGVADDDYSNDARDYTKSTVDSNNYNHDNSNRYSPNSVRSNSSLMNNDDTDDKDPSSLEDDISTSDRIFKMELDDLQPCRSKRLLPNPPFIHKSRGLDLRGPSRHQRPEHRQAIPNNSHNTQMGFLNNVSQSRCSTNGRQGVARQDGTSSAQSKHDDDQIVQEDRKPSLGSLDRARNHHLAYQRDQNNYSSEDDSDQGETAPKTDTEVSKFRSERRCPSNETQYSGTSADTEKWPKKEPGAEETSCNTSNPTSPSGGPFDVSNDEQQHQQHRKRIKLIEGRIMVETDLSRCIDSTQAGYLANKDAALLSVGESELSN